MATEAEHKFAIDEMKRALEEMKGERDKYAFLFDDAPVGYFTFNRDGNICSANVIGAELLGVDRADLVGRKFEQFIVDEDSLKFSSFRRKVFSSRQKETCRLELAKAYPQPVFVRIEALVNSTGEECQAVLLDITPKKQAEQALSESEYNLAKAQAMTHVGSWSYDPVTTEVQASAELLRIMHLAPEQVSHEVFASVVHPNDYDMVMEHLRNGIKGKSYEIEHRLLFDDGTLRWVYTIVEPSVNNVGQVLKLYGTTQDITLRKQAEVDLRNKTNELQTIFDSISDGIVVYDYNGSVQHHNLISPQLFPEKIFPGSSCKAIFHPEADSDLKECPVERALNGERVDISLVVNDVQAAPLYVDVTATPIKDALGEKNRALVFIRDVSEKRHQEMHLIQVEKMSSVGVLATGMAHEINNPLTSIAGCAEALLRRFHDAPALEEDSRLDVFPRYLEVITRESYRCKGIIEHLLSFGSTSDGSARKVDVNLALEEIVELLRYQPNCQQIRVACHLLPVLPRIKGDPSGLRQVFMNLLVNAHQSIEGAGGIEITTDKLDSDFISIIIRDTGCGMEQRIIDRIWEPFFTTKEVGQGVGLGLALTYNIVKEHGGEIVLESQVGKGTEFKILLPIWQE
ncbi:MAG: PAS domain S-box protein [Desulfuromonas sp.]|nr:PAS domain S-box protein [Desulfuromonas sp.]